MAMLATVTSGSLAFGPNWCDNQAMTTRQVLIVGGVVGLGCRVRRTLRSFWFGVAGILVIGNINLRHMFWPSSVMLVALAGAARFRA